MLRSPLGKRSQDEVVTTRADLRVAYLVGKYPSVSHTFIVREVLALRARGIDVRTVSINRATERDTLSAADKAEAERTFSVLPPRWPILLRAHASALLSRPARYFATLGRAVRLARPGIRGLIWELFYFGEAVVVWRHLRAQGI